MKDFEIERKFNKIGGLDLIKFYVPPLSRTVNEETHLILSLPHEVAYQTDPRNEMICVRELETGEIVRLKCEIATVQGEDGQIIRSARLLGLCDRYYVCFENEPVTFAVGVINPSTNHRSESLSNRFSIILRQADGLDVGYG